MNFWRGILIILLFLPGVSFAQTPPMIQITTDFQRTKTNPYPFWLLILRDVDNGTVTPFLFDFTQPTNSWVAPAPGHNYRITASEMVFSASRTIHNFCGLQNGVLSGKSIIATVRGRRLTSNPDSYTCHTIKY